MYSQWTLPNVKKKEFQCVMELAYISSFLFNNDFAKLGVSIDEYNNESNTPTAESTLL